MKLQKIEVNNSVSKDETDFSEIEKNSYVPVDVEIKRQPVAISIGEHNYKGQMQPTPFGSYGDYSCIVGSSKSRKTFLKSAIMASYIGGNANNLFPNIKGFNTQNKLVIDIDTEQSKYHSQWAFKRVCQMVGANYEGYRGYSLRGYSAPDRLKFIDWLVYKSPYRGKIGLISIDGYADLVNDYNSLEQSNELQQKLLSWTTDAECHITGVLHKNFNSEKPVGHVGSAVLKKAETVVFTEKKEGETLVSCEYSRNIPFDDFQFGINNNWLPYETDVF